MFACANSNPIDKSDPQGKFAIGSIVGTIIGSISGGVGAWHGGGGFFDILIGIGIGGGLGFALGLIDPSEGILTIAGISSLSGMEGGAIGQLITHDMNWHCLNYGEIAGAGFFNLIGGAIGAGWAMDSIAYWGPGLGDWIGSIGAGVGGFMPITFGPEIGKNMLQPEPD